MAGGLIKSIFDDKKELHDAYRTISGRKAFDLEREHAFYGRIDLEGDVIYLDSPTFLSGVESEKNSTNLVMDIVAEAYWSFKANYRKAITAVSRSSLYYRNLKVYKSRSYAGLDSKYETYVSALYRNFVNVYLASNRRMEKIRNFKDFTREFLRYVLRMCYYYPITKSGFILSTHCSPFVSGLMLEIAPEEHGIQNNKKIIQYTEDENYDFWVNQAAKFGFMVDKNAPWRLVFNVASGHKERVENDKLTGAQIFMNKFGVTYENIFKYRFIKAYTTDLLDIKNLFFSLYRNFYEQYNTYEEEKYQFGGSCGIKTSHKRIARDPPPGKLSVYGGKMRLILKDQDDEYWLKVLLKLKMSETRHPHTPTSYDARATSLIKKYRLFGLNTALQYINDLTKGLTVTKFNKKGSYWHGHSDFVYEQRLQETLNKAESPQSAQDSLTGTGNIKK